MTEAPVAHDDAAPQIAHDEPSDGVIRELQDEPKVIVRLPPVEVPPDDRPDDATGEITSPISREELQEMERVEPTILVADLQAVHTAVSAVATTQAAAPHTTDAVSAGTVTSLRAPPSAQGA